MHDFRSDTVTRPTPAMREAMANAVVGDDVFQDDPTVQALERDVAARFDREAALFVPSGTQGNQIAAHLHAGPGEEVAVGENSHSYDWELAGLAALSGLQARLIPAPRGCVDVDVVSRTLRPAGGFRPACRLLLVENTHNFLGGAVVPLAHLQALHEVATERGAKLHLDGARLWHASVAEGTPLAAYGKVADSIMVCLSKALGAPVGSMLIGDADFITNAREVRKMLGGGMRQVGVLAAPAQVALDQQLPLLVYDHQRATRLAEGLSALPGVSLVYGMPDTNIVFVRFPTDAPRLQETLRDAGVAAIATGPDVIRFVTHYDVDDGSVGAALEAITAALAA